MLSAIGFSASLAIAVAPGLGSDPIALSSSAGERHSSQLRENTKEERKRSRRAREGGCREPPAQTTKQSHFSLSRRRVSGGQCAWPAARERKKRVPASLPRPFLDRSSNCPHAQRRSKWFSSEEKARGLFPNRAHEPNISFPKPKKPRRRRKRN
jgi:hypothetical protein